jgi:phosphoglycolate phosphatase-like HAD superfamily hydrolase
MKPLDTICIGDELRDIEAAKAAGMDSGAVAWGYALPGARSNETSNGSVRTSVAASHAA